MNITSSRSLLTKAAILLIKGSAPEVGKIQKSNPIFLNQSNPFLLQSNPNLINIINIIYN